MGGLGRLGFLRNFAPTSDEVKNLICGVTKTKTPEKRGARPIIDVILHNGQDQHQVRALLDPGCSINLMNQRTADKLGILRKKHEKTRTVESFTGTIVQGAGQYYTEPMRLQHRKHWTKEVFEISPMEDNIDIFLPFSWIEQHPPQGAWSSNEEVRFNSVRCLEKCTKFETNPFSLTWDDSILLDEQARPMGRVSAVAQDPLTDVPREFRQYLGIMSKEAADQLPEHRSYDCKIEESRKERRPLGDQSTPCPRQSSAHCGSG